MLLATFAGAGAAGATPLAAIDYVETDVGGGLFQYDIVVHNLADPLTEAGFDIFDVTLFFSPATDAIGAATPADWDAIVGSGFAQAFSLLPGAAPAGADIGPGASLAGFSFTLTAPIESTSFEVLFANPSDPNAPIPYAGTTAPLAVVTPVPEPGCLVLLGSGLAGLAVRIRRRRGSSGPEC